MSLLIYQFRMTRRICIVLHCSLRMKSLLTGKNSPITMEVFFLIYKFTPTPVIFFIEIVAFGVFCFPAFWQRLVHL